MTDPRPTCRPFTPAVEAMLDQIRAERRDSTRPDDYMAELGYGPDNADDRDEGFVL